MGRKRHGSITQECPEVIGVLMYLHEKGDTESFRWRSGNADLKVYEEILAEKRLGDPTAIMAEETVEPDLENDEDFYLTNAPDML